MTRSNKAVIQCNDDPIPSMWLMAIFPIRSEKKAFTGEVSHFQALATAVSGTVGLGNIAGVAVAIAVGGPGATFWMIVCGLLGMSSKFVECTLGVKYRDIDGRNSLRRSDVLSFKRFQRYWIRSGAVKFFAVIFAIMCVGGSFGGGNVFQSNQATVQITSMTGLEGGAIKTIDRNCYGDLGRNRYNRRNQKNCQSYRKDRSVYGWNLCYCFFDNYICEHFISYRKLSVEIFAGAFTPAAGVGGLIGALLVGFQRAAFSNEAGAGSAAIAHSAVNTNLSRK